MKKRVQGCGLVKRRTCAHLEEVTHRRHVRLAAARQQGGEYCDVGVGGGGGGVWWRLRVVCTGGGRGGCGPPAQQRPQLLE